MAQNEKNYRSSEQNLEALSSVPRALTQEDKWGA